MRKKPTHHHFLVRSTALLFVALRSFAANTPVDAVDPKSLRDPFKRPVFEEKSEEQKTELEKFPVTDFTMVGVLTGPHRTRALLQAGGKVYIVSDGARIGVRNGYIRKILEDRVIVNETVQDLLGAKEVVTTEIKQVVSHGSLMPQNEGKVTAGETQASKAALPASNAKPPPAGIQNFPSGADVDKFRQLLGIDPNSGSGAGATTGNLPPVDLTAERAAQPQAPAPQPTAPAASTVTVPTYVAPGQVGTNQVGVPATGTK